MRAAFADREENLKSLVSGGGSGGGGGKGGGGSKSTYPINFIRGRILPQSSSCFCKLSQVKIGKPDFNPVTQKIEEVSIFFPIIYPNVFA